MSTINAIMAELQAGEAAKARVPELERTLADYTRKLDEAHQHNQNLELRAKAREETILKQAETIAKLREERDDASFRVLETEERLNTFMDAVGNAFGGIGNALQAVKPQKPTEPEVKPTSPLPATATGNAATGGASSSASAGQPGTGQSDGGPTAASQAKPSENVGTAESQTAQGNAVPKPADASPEGQRAPSPTVSPASPTTGGQSLSAEPSGVESIGAAASGHTSQSSQASDWKPSVEMPEVRDTTDEPSASKPWAQGDSDAKRPEPAVYKPFSDPPKPDWNDKP